MKKFKFLLLFILIIPFFSINALTLCDGTELPDIPLDNNYTNYVITEWVPDSIYRVFVFRNTANVYINNNTLYFSDINYVRRYTLSNGSWGIPNTNQNYNFVLSNDGILNATTIDILDGNNVIYSANYNIECTSPTPVVPQDFSIINYIANIINYFVVSLQSNNVSIHTIFIGLIIFNFLVFVLCYIISHLE